MKQLKLSIENFVHAVMVVFAIASIFNIANYLASNGHNPITSYGLGIALGGVLVAVSIMLTHVDFDNERFTFWAMLVTVGVIGLLSGTVQTWSYASHGATRFNAALMGFGFPLIGEGVLAVACAMYIAAEKRKRIRRATDSTQEKIADAISMALSDIDLSKVQRYAEKKVDAIVRAQVDAVASQLIPEKEEGFEPDTTANGNNNSVISPQITAKPESTLPGANEARYRQIEGRRQAIIAAITANGPLGIAELAEKLRDDFGVTSGIGEKTLREDCKVLVADGQLVKVGRKWTLSHEQEAEPQTASTVEVPPLPKIKPEYGYSNGVSM